MDTTIQSFEPSLFSTFTIMDTIRETFVEFWRYFKNSTSYLARSVTSYLGFPMTSVQIKSLQGTGHYLKASRISEMGIDHGAYERENLIFSTAFSPQGMPQTASPIPHTLRPPVCPAMDPMLLSEMCSPCFGLNTIKIQLPPRSACPVLSIAGRSAHDIFTFFMCFIALAFCLLAFLESLRPRTRKVLNSDHIFRYKDRLKRARQNQEAHQAALTDIIRHIDETQSILTASSTAASSDSVVALGADSDDFSAVLSTANEIKGARISGLVDADSLDNFSIDDEDAAIGENQSLPTSDSETDIKDFVTLVADLASQLCALSSSTVPGNISQGETIPSSFPGDFPLDKQGINDEKIDHVVPKVFAVISQTPLDAPANYMDDGLGRNGDDDTSSMPDLEDVFVESQDGGSWSTAKETKLPNISKDNFPVSISPAIDALGNVSISSTMVCASSSDNSVRYNITSASSSVEGLTEGAAASHGKFLMQSTEVQQRTCPDQAMIHEGSLVDVSLGEMKGTELPASTGRVSAWAMEISTLEADMFKQSYPENAFASASEITDGNGTAEVIMDDPENRVDSHRSFAAKIDDRTASFITLVPSSTAEEPMKEKDVGPPIHDTQALSIV